MPTYEYRCDGCGHELTIEQRITEPKLELCPKCAEKKLVRLISGGTFILKGGGWYADLYSKPPGGGSSSGGSSHSALSHSASSTTSDAPSCGQCASSGSTDSSPSGSTSGSS